MTSLRRLPDGRSLYSLNRSETDYLYREIFLERVYVPPGRLHLPDKPVVFDVGANIGLFSLFASEEWPGSRVYAFEPAPEVFGVLERNTAALPGVTAFRLALGDTAGTRDLTFYPGYTMMSGFDADPERDQHLVMAYAQNFASTLGSDQRRRAYIETAGDLLPALLRPELVSCQVETLETLASRLAVREIDLLKIDVEGSELAVLRGMGDWVWPGLGNAVVEVTDDDGALSQVLELLHAHGMVTSCAQGEHYQGTPLYMVYASRI